MHRWAKLYCWLHSFPWAAFSYVGELFQPFNPCPAVVNPFAAIVLQVYLNGNLIHTGSTWEALYLGWQNANITPPRKQAVDSLQFRTEKPSQAANLGQGFIFSKVVVTNPPALA